MYRRDDDDCMCKSKEYSKEYSKKYEYARAYILPQKYENLYSCKEGFVKGTYLKTFTDHIKNSMIIKAMIVTMTIMSMSTNMNMIMNMNLNTRKSNTRGDIIL